MGRMENVALAESGRPATRRLSVVDHLRSDLLERAAALPPGPFTVRGTWRIDLQVRPHPDERCFRYEVLSVQTAEQGCCYAAAPGAPIPEGFLGADGRTLVGLPRDLDIALLDAMYGSLAPHDAGSHLCRLNGAPDVKARRRAQIVAHEVAELVGARSGARVVNVGAVGAILAALREAGCRATASDFDPEVVGTVMGGVPVHPGTTTLDLVATSDVAVVTGMALATGTLDDIVDVARACRTRVVMFAETGAHFGRWYCDRLGVDAVVSEHFPFYVAAGPSVIAVHRRRRPRWHA